MTIAPDGRRGCRGDGRVLRPDPADLLAAAAERALSRDGKDVLDDLAKVYGFTWVDVARMIGVNVPTIRKWRMVGGITPEHHAKLSCLAAFARLLQQQGVAAAVWLSAPMLPGYWVAPKHLYTAERAAALIDVACHSQDPAQFLDSVDPNWRTTFDAHGYDVVRFNDGTYGVAAT